MYTRIKAGKEIEGTISGVIHVPSQAMPINLDGLTNGEIISTLVQMAQAITLQAHVIGFD